MRHFTKAHNDTTLTPVLSGMRRQLLLLLLITVLPFAAGTGFAYDLTEIDGDDDHGDEMVIKGWESGTDVPYIMVEGNNPTGISNTDWTTTVDASFQSWEDVENCYLTFTYETGTGITGSKVTLTSPQSPSTYYSQRLTAGSGPPTDAGTLNVIASIDDWDAFGLGSQALAVTATLFFPSTRYIVSADMFVNNDPTSGITWAIGDTPGTYDLQNVITHEAGHFIGIGHPESQTLRIDSTMYFEAGTGEINKRDLETDDQNAAVYLYPEDGATLVPPDNNLQGLRDEITGEWTTSSGGGTDPGGTDGGGGGGGCTTSNGPVNAAGVLLSWIGLICFVFAVRYFAAKKQPVAVPVKVQDNRIPVEKRDRRNGR
jgi:hypothetical protein